MPLRFCFRKQTAFFIALLCFALLANFNAYASTAGGACTISGAVERDSGQTLICNGTVWKLSVETTTAGKALMQVNEDAGGCTSDKAGRLSYAAAGDDWTYCNGTTWIPFKHFVCQGPESCPNPGNVCTDGTVFAGCAATDYHRMFTTRCDANQVWNGSACTGTAGQSKWANDNDPTNLRATGVTDFVNGQANTTALTNGVISGTGDSKSTAGLQNHDAAKFCADLSSNGYGDTNGANGTVYTDWHLPAGYELTTMYMHATAIGNFTAGVFWASTELSNVNAVTVSFSTGDVSGGGKETSNLVRCIRLE